MKKVPEDELFSAYLDGELTAAEQAKVEQLLATSPAARQLMDELRALSLTLQSLPVERVGEDLSEGVLHAAERRMLEDPGHLDRHPSAVIGNGSSWRLVFRRLARPRNLLWPVAAIAAAWLLTANPELGQKAPPKNGAKQIAEAPPEERPAPARNETIGPLREPEKRPTGVAAAPSGGPPAPEKPNVAKVAKSDTGDAAAKVPATGAPSVPPAMPSVPPPPKPSAVAASPVPATKSPPPEKAKPSPEPETRAAPKGVDEVLIVRCDVTEEAVAKELLEKTLEKRGLAPQRKTPPPQGESPAGKPARCFEVEATTAEILAALGDLKAQPEMFRAVSLPPGLLPGGPGGKAPKPEGVAKPGVFKVQVRIGAQPLAAKDSAASIGTTGAQGVPVGPSGGQSIEIRPPGAPKAPNTAKRRVQFVLRIVPSAGP